LLVVVFIEVFVSFLDPFIEIDFSTISRLFSQSSRLKPLTMGVSDLNPFLREKCPRVFIRRRLSSFSGKRVAIDANNWMFRMMAVAHKRIVDTTDVLNDDPDRDATIKLWFSLMMDDILVFLNHGITPVFVFDGAYPEQKNRTKAERRKTKDDVRTRLATLKEQVESVDLLLRTPAMYENLKKLLRQLIYVAKSEEETFRNLLVGIGLPCLQAAGESEQLCSMLCRQGKVTAVYSADTDNLPYGCPFLISELDYENAADGRHRICVTVKIDDILRELQLTQQQFLDLCIMMGCDYNQSIPQVGPNRAYNLIKKFGDIEGIPRLPGDTQLINREECKCGLPQSYKGVQLEYNVRSLNHEFCRKQFSGVNQQELRGLRRDENSKEDQEPIQNDNLDVDRTIFKENARDILGMYDLLRLLERFATAYKNLPAPAEDVVPATSTPERVNQTQLASSRPRVTLVVAPESPIEAIKPNLCFQPQSTDC
jgi:5'-3' exonuclease